jgi:hypothetical protein
MKFTALIVAVILMAFGSYQVAAADVNVCGQLNAYQPARSKDGKPQNTILSLKTSVGFVDYQLVLDGTVPADLGQDPALPEVLRLTGRTVEGVNTVADYTVTRVASCSLPSTSTAAATTAPGLFGSIASAIAVLFAFAGALVTGVNHRKAAS